MEFLTRGNYGRLLEPDGNWILHGAGQSPEAFQEYVETVVHRPALYMAYTGLRGLKAETLQQQQAEFERWDAIPQLGLCMTKDGTPEEHYEHEVAAGHHDDALDRYCEWLAQLQRPAYVRIGYEFNGHWNGYEPGPYKDAWHHVIERFAKHGLKNAARVWCFSCDGRNKSFMDFYPGDDAVDWWSIDTFSKEHFTVPHALEFAQEAERRKFPVLIGESTPRYVGVENGAQSWADWFEPYFRYMAENPALKGFSYINWEWSAYPMWSKWGDGRIEGNEEVRARWNEMLNNPVFLHGGREATARLVGV